MLAGVIKSEIKLKIPVSLAVEYKLLTSVMPIMSIIQLFAKLPIKEQCAGDTLLQTLQTH